jgi:hypothetical protein
MTKLYVQIVGSYDVTIVGPFATLDAVEAFKKTIPPQFNWCVMSPFDLDKNFAEFGECKIESPDQYGFDGDYTFTENR